MNKQLILQAIIEALDANHHELELAVKTAQERATHEETKPENKYDTFGLEASYLVHGQAKRVQEIEEALLSYRTVKTSEFTDDSAVALGALVLIEDLDENERWIWLGEYAGGIEVSVDDQLITVVTPESPLGNALMGKMLDDEVVLQIDGIVTKYTLTNIE